jgi:hypothetical protein
MNARGGWALALFASAALGGCDAILQIGPLPIDKDSSASSDARSDVPVLDANDGTVTEAATTDVARTADTADTAEAEGRDAALDDVKSDQFVDDRDGGATDALSRPDVVCPPNPPFICADASAPDGYTFFADFDETCLSVPILNQGQPSLVEFSCDKSVSPPASLHLRVPSLGNYNPYLQLQKSLPAFPQHAHVELDLFVESHSFMANTIAFALGADKTASAGSGFGFYLYPDPNTATQIDCYVQDYQPGMTSDQSQNCTGGLTLQTWSHLVFDLTHSDGGAPMHLTIALSGAPGLLFDHDLRGFVDGPNFHFDLSNGTFQDGGGYWNLYFDNVAVVDTP